MNHRRHNVGFLPAAAAPAIAGSGPAAPFVAAAMLAAPFVAKLMQNIGRGCGQSCELTADAANQIEAQLKANLLAYQNSARTRAIQSAALAVFDGYWQTLVEYCGKPEFQTTKAGRNCIADRQQGACKWKGEDGQCWNWFTGYRDPIALDTDVKPDQAPQGGTDILTAITGQEGDANGNWLLPAAIVAIALAL